MPTNNIIKALITVFALHIYVDLTFAAPHRSSPKKRAISVYDTVPCFVNIRLSGQRMPPCISLPEDYMVDDSIGFVKENNRQRMGKKNVIFLYRKALPSFHINATISNSSNLDTVFLETPTGQHGAFQFELFKVTPKGNHQIYFSNIENEPHRYYTEMILPGDTVNMYAASLHLGPNNHGLDTGEYLIRCFYKHKCKNKVILKHSNDVHFCVIN